MYSKLEDTSSCCHAQSDGCGNGIQTLKNFRDISNQIYGLGCMEIIRDKLEGDVVPMMVMYSCVGVGRRNFYNALVVVIDCWVVGGQLFSALECVIKAKSREKRY